MNELLGALKGKRTYLVCGLAAVLLFGGWQHWWVMPDEIEKALMFAALAFLRASVPSDSNLKT
jgi:NADH:ubiquinone oxidoreductase subunit H